MKVPFDQRSHAPLFPLSYADSSISWPPPDPDRIRRTTRKPDQIQGFTYPSSTLSSEGYIEAFRQRQQEDLKRFTKETPTITRRKPFHDPYRIHDNGKEPFLQRSTSTSKPGGEAWRNFDGDRLDDFGVDENTELYDEDEIPVAAFLKHQKKSLSNDYGKESAS